MEIPKRLQDPAINFVLLEKSGKKPFQQGWQKKEIKFDDEELTKHEGNYGVMGGGEKNLIIVDFDAEKIQEEVLPKLPATFTVKTGSGLLHKYFWSDKSESFKVFNKEMDTLADIQGKGKQVVGAGSIHPNGNLYEITEDVEIATIEYSEIKAIMMQYDKKPKKELPKQEVVPKEYSGDFIDDVKTHISLEGVLSHFGVDTSRTPTNCPLHDSKGGKCLGWDNETAHCFHCEGSWNIFSFTMANKNIDFPEALEYLCEHFGMTDEFNAHRKKWVETNRTQNLRVITDKNTQEGMFAKAQPYFYDRYKLWWMWNELEYRWDLVDDVEVLNMINLSCGQDIITSKARTETLNILKQEGRKNVPKPIKPTWIQFKDTIVDVMTGEQFKATPEYFVKNPIPHKLGDLPDTPVMDKIFTEWVGEKYVPLLYEILAYSLLPDMPLHRIFCFLGAGMNGKSKFLELLRYFIGTDNCCSTELDTLLQSRFEVSRLHKKLVCQMGETNFNEMNKTSILKKLSGGDLIGFEYKGKDPFEELNYAKIIIATNNLPTTSDKTIGFYRRWILIDFPNTFSEKKDILAEIPIEEYKNLALKSIVLLRGVLETRKFTNEGTIEERIERYESKSNFLEKFIDLFITEDFTGYITVAEFNRKFKEWCKENRHREMAERTVSLALKKLKWEGVKKHFDWLHDGKGGQARCWVNVRWK